MRIKNKGSVFTEYIVVLLVCSLGIYFAFVGNNDEPDATGIPPLVEAVHDRQSTFVDSILQP